MVFLLEDIAKIEAERGIESGLTETYIHLQRTTDIFMEPETAKVINSIMEPYCQFAEFYVWGKSIIGVLGVFTDAFLNAGMWGNNNTPGKKITATMKYGIFGSAIYVEDEGEGFDYLTQIRKLSNGESHNYSHHGGGMRKFNESHLLISYHGKGNLISIASPVFTLDDANQFLRHK